MVTISKYFKFLRSQMTIIFREIRVTDLDVSGARCHLCGGDATKHVSRRSVLTGNVYGDAMCTRCSVAWELSGRRSEGLSGPNGS
jgi:hypothetical protein